MMLAVGLSYVTVIILRYVNSNYFAESLYHKWMFFFFLNAFSAFRWSYLKSYLFFTLLMWYIKFIN